MSASGGVDELEVVGFVGDGLVAEAADDAAVFEEEDAGHLLGVLAKDDVDAVAEERAFEPSAPDGEAEGLKERIGATEGEEWVLVERGVGIADAFDVGELVIVEVEFGAFRRAEMDEDGADAAGGNLRADFGNLVERLTAESAAEVAEKDEEDWGLVDEFEKERPDSARTSLRSATRSTFSLVAVVMKILMLREAGNGVTAV